MYFNRQQDINHFPLSTWSKTSGQSNTRMISWILLNTHQSAIINPEYSAWHWTQTHFISTTQSLHLLRALSCTVLTCFKAKVTIKTYNTLWKDHQHNFKISPFDLDEIQQEMKIVFKVTLNKLTNCWGGFALFYKTKLQHYRSLETKHSLKYQFTVCFWTVSPGLSAFCTETGQAFKLWEVQYQRRKSWDIFITPR